MPRRLRRRRTSPFEIATEEKARRLLKEAKKRGYPVEITEESIPSGYRHERGVILANPEIVAFVFNKPLEFGRFDWQREFWTDMKRGAVRKEAHEELDRMGISMETRESPLFVSVEDIFESCRFPRSKDYIYARRYLMEDMLRGTPKEKREEPFRLRPRLLTCFVLTMTEKELNEYFPFPLNVLVSILKSEVCKIDTIEEVCNVHDAFLDTMELIELFKE